MKKVIVLGGGNDQIALILELQKRGYFVILVDYLDAPIAKGFADMHIQESTLDVEKVKTIAIKENVCLITTACTDQALLTMAKASEELSLPSYISYKTALTVTNKLYMKKMMMDNNIPTSKFVVVTDLRYKDSFASLSLPLVVKPVDCNSSKGVVKVTKREDIDIVLLDAINFSRTKNAIIEEYKSGVELSVDLYIDDEGVKLLSVTDSIKIKNNDRFVICGSSYPVEGIDKNKIISIAHNIASVFGICNSPMLIQMIMDGNGDLSVIEFSARMGGGSKYYLIESLCGVNIISSYTDLILGVKPKIHPIASSKFVEMRYLYCNNGIFDYITYLDELMVQGFISKYFIYKSTGSIINGSNNSGDRVGGVLIEANSKQELQDKISYLMNKIQILDKAGNDILLHVW